MARESDNGRRCDNGSMADGSVGRFGAGRPVRAAGSVEQCGVSTGCEDLGNSSQTAMRVRPGAAEAVQR